MKAKFSLSKNPEIKAIFKINAVVSDQYVEKIYERIDEVQANVDEEVLNRQNADIEITNSISELDAKVDGININLTRQIDDLEQDVNNKYNELIRDIDDLTDVVEEDYNTLNTKINTTSQTINTRITNVADELNQTIEENVVALQQEDTALQNQINTHSSTLTNHNQRITNNTNAIAQEIINRQNADNDLQEQIDGITASSNVKDIVGTYRELQTYDKSKLGNNDIIKVLQDETRENTSTYYRYIILTQSFTYIGEEGPFYTRSEADILLNEKQDKLIAGENITIENNVISSTGGRGASSFSELEGSPYDNQALANELNSLNIISLLLVYLRDSLNNNLLDKNGLTLIARR